MPATHKNRLVCTVSAVASAGLGAWTVSTASSGYRTFAAGDDAKTFDVVCVEGTAWEVRTGCTYTHSGTTLSRGTLEDSSTGSAITFTSACVLSVTLSAGRANALEVALQSLIPGGRLTLTSGTPVTTSDVTGATSIYYTPYVSNGIALWDSGQTKWVPVIFAETTLALGTLTSGLPYDVFGYLSSGALALELLAWTNGTTRATAVTLQDGRYCKSGDKTRLYLGTFYTTSTTATEDSVTKRFLFNAYNRRKRRFKRFEGSANYNYTSATIRQVNATAANKVEAVIGLSEDMVSVECGMGLFTSTGAVSMSNGIGYDSTTAYSSDSSGGGFYGVSSATLNARAFWRDVPSIGYHYWSWNESGASGATQDISTNAGIQGEVMA